MSSRPSRRPTEARSRIVPTCRARKLRPGCESLEHRQLLTAMYVEPLSYGQLDLTHFNTLQNALAASSPGDVITIEPNAVVVPLQRSTGLLSAPVALGSNTIDTNMQLPTDQYVTLGVNGQRDLVDKVQPGPLGTYIETLSQPVLAGLPGGLSIVPDSSTIGIDKPVTIIGEQAVARFGTNLSLELAPGAGLGTVLSHLNLTSLKLDSGSVRDLVTDCAIGTAVESNSGGNTFLGDLITGGLSILGGPATTAGDLIQGNTFADGTGQTLAGAAPIFSATQDNGLTVIENRFSENSLGATALSVVNSNGVTIARNTLTSNSNLPQILVTGPAANAIISNNSVNTSGLGIGIQVNVGTALIGSQTSVKVEGNDLRANRVGLSLVGDGIPLDTSGTVDAGGGSLGSNGGNDFRGMTAAGVASGVFAIQVAGTSPTTTLAAADNIWDASILANPSAVVKDGTHNTLQGLASAPGSGVVNVGATQLTTDQEYIQALSNQFLSKTTPVSGLAPYVAQLATIGRAGVANEIIHSDAAYDALIEQAYEQYLGRYADPVGMAGYLNYLHSHTEEQFLGQILGSTEFATRAKATTGSAALDGSFLQDAFQVEAGRLPTVDELDMYTDQIIQGGRQAVASIIPTLAAVRTNLVSNFYTTIIHRNYQTSTAEIQGYVNSGLDDLSIEVSMASSNEYYLNG